MSGYCECVDGRITAKSTCEHHIPGGFTCYDKCKALAEGDPGSKNCDDSLEAAMVMLVVGVVVRQWF